MPPHRARLDRCHKSENPQRKIQTVQSCEKLNLQARHHPAQIQEAKLDELRRYLPVRELLAWFHTVIGSMGKSNWTKPSSFNLPLLLVTVQQTVLKLY